ncbi:DUF6457 domain-containing protein [Glaciihabitans sp. dw_435]|uniref:DUF6457 domain-containing protein n=1 Tax=Glaciihabitans sp. dw_435 TaxID=2720081 RepID=UPI0021079D5A|nr:DUF6457 domain-containing protein [Glaciihabitans sp. dw_435]
MTYDAVVLAGGRSSRLGAGPKAALVYDGETLLARTLGSVASARRIVIVGEVSSPAELPAGVGLTREEPAFSGPAAAIAAGVSYLADTGDVPSEFTVVLACDMPLVAGAVEALLAPGVRAELTDGVVDGSVAIDRGGRHQQLAGIYATAALRRAVSDNAGALENLPVRTLFARLRLSGIPAPDGTTDDIDTPAHARAFGIALPDGPPTHPTTTTPDPSAPPESNGAPMSHDSTPLTDDEKTAVLAAWSQKLTAELGIRGVAATIDIDAVLGLAGVAAHAVLRPAAPLTTYIVGYAAGLAAARGEISATEAFDDAVAIAKTLARAEQDDDPQAGAGQTETEHSEAGTA